MFRRIAIGGLLTALILTVFVVHTRRSGAPEHAPAPRKEVAKTYEQLAAGNYRTLSAAQSSKLLRFATAFRSCMDDRGIQLTAPLSTPTKIMLHIEATPKTATIRAATVACGDRLGGPPTGSSLQTPRGHADLIVLYLPKQCLLDPTVTSG